MLLFLPVVVMAQDKDVFRGTVYNEKYDVYLTMNFYDKNVTIRGQEVLGEMDGYIGDPNDYRKWLIVEAVVTDNDKAQLVVSNLEGSEDLRATLTYDGHDSYTLRQNSGSTIKFARNQKWLKLPKSLTFTREK